MTNEQLRIAILQMATYMRDASDIEKSGMLESGTDSEKEKALNNYVGDYVNKIFDIIHKVFIDVKGDFYIDRAIKEELEYNNISFDVVYDDFTKYYNVVLGYGDFRIVAFSSNEEGFRKKIGY